MKFALSTAALLVLSSPALADLTVRFSEGAPKDRFILENSGACALPALRVVIDLAPSPFGLVFDTTPTGAGVEVFQPFELIEGAHLVVDTPQVLDGDTAVTLALSGFAPGDRVAFTIDVDDTAGAREITVSGSEIASAVVKAHGVFGTLSASFGTSAVARLTTAACLS